MRLLSRDELLQLEPEVLLATAECHGVPIEGRRANEVLDELADLIEAFAEMFGEAEG